jgi:beta-phosphoglucomutase-like phosphatase (HAD superfamily)
MQSTAPAFTAVRRLVNVVLADLYGVLMQTAKLHEAAWKALFDSSL